MTGIGYHADIGERPQARLERSSQGRRHDSVGNGYSVRVERRAAVAAEMADSGERETDGRPEKPSQGARFKLADLGVSETPWRLVLRQQTVAAF
jgi:hypothetical protein